MRRPLSASKLARIRQLLLDAYWIADTRVLESFAMIALELATDAERAKPGTIEVINSGDFVMRMTEPVMNGDPIGIGPDGQARALRPGDWRLGIAVESIMPGQEILWSPSSNPIAVPPIVGRR